MWFRSAVPSPWSSLNTWSPRSSVQTLRPCEPRGAVDESDHLGPEAHAGALRAREQHRPSQVEDRAAAIRAEGDASGGCRRRSTSLRIPATHRPLPAVSATPSLVRRPSRQGPGRAVRDATTRHREAIDRAAVSVCPSPWFAQVVDGPAGHCDGVGDSDTQARRELLDVVRSCIPCSSRFPGIGGRQRRAAGWLEGVRVPVPREPCAHASSRMVTMPQIVSRNVGAPKHVSCLPPPAWSAGMVRVSRTGLEHRCPRSRTRRSGPTATYSRSSRRNQQYDSCDREPA